MADHYTPQRYTHGGHVGGLPMTWRGTLEAMCSYYGNFAGRWHSHFEWYSIQQRISSMTEEEAYEELIKINQRAEARRALWESYQ